MAVVIAIIVALCAVAGLDAFAGPLVSFSVREWPLAVQGQRIVGAVEGPLKQTDDDRRVVRVASGFLGLWSLPVIVTPDTTIAVDGKLGWWGDLQRRLLVRVAYEVAPDDRLIASRVDVLGAGAHALAGLPIAGSPEGARDAPALSLPGATAAMASPPGDETTARTEARPSVPAPIASPVQTPAGTAASSRKKSARHATTTAVSTPPPATSTLPARPSPGSAGAAVALPAPPPTLSQSERPAVEDGGAAIDWLLKESPGGR